MAKQYDVRVILDPAPAQKLPETLYPLISIITPNLSEAEQLVGFPITNKDEIIKAAKRIKDHGAQDVIIKMGSQGAFGIINDKEIFFKPFSVQAIDTVAAGDAFNGAMAVALTEGFPLEQAIIWGMAGGALAVTKKGAQSSMPAREDVIKLLEAENCQTH